MSRAVAAVVATFLGLVALASFKSSPGLPKSSSALVTPRSGAVAAAPPKGSTTSTLPPTTSTTTPTSTPGTTPNTSRTPTTSTTPTTASNAVRTIDGDSEDNQYGTVQVEVTLQGSRITNVVALQLPQDREHSAELSQQAGPILAQEVLQAQSAQIDVVSGATYTSDGYAQSVQSALDKA